MRALFSFALLSVLFWPVTTTAQNWGNVSGTVTELETGLGIPGATVVVAGTNFGTAATADGSYNLRLPAGRYLFQVSSVGFEMVLDSVFVFRNRVTDFSVRLRQSVEQMGEIQVEADAVPLEAGVYGLSPQEIQNIPAPFKDVTRGLKVLPGVVSNNELSNQYSVRGGGFNENLLFVNGFEVYLPFRPRQGEQEGLSLLNPELTERVVFYSGGFPARYGGKLSSALDVTYRRPLDEKLQGSAYASLLDAGVSASSSTLNGNVGWMAGVRKAQASRFFATQDLKGEYQPDYTDMQGLLVYRLSDGHSIEVLGMYADHVFELDPNSRRTFFGTVSQDTRIAPSNLKALFTNFDEDNFETDGYTTTFVAARLSNQVSRRLNVSHDVSFFGTEESESFELSGTSILFLVDPGSGDPDTGEGLFDTGTARQEDKADNAVSVDTWTAQGRYMLSHEKQLSEIGWHARGLQFDDRINESRFVIGPSLDGDIIRIQVDSLLDSASLSAQQYGGYVQHMFDIREFLPGHLAVTGGIRTDYYSFNEQLTVSPRLSVRYAYSPNLSFVGSWGIYYQAPTYRELRGKPETGETILGSLNRDLKSQRSNQFVAGFEYFFPRRRFNLRGESYYKRLSNVISYDIENVRVRYSGENDARSNTYGLDLQLRGELVPGLESWVNYSYLNAREDFLSAFETEATTGSNPRPTDQRHTISLFVQDYIPNDPRWKLHMRTLFGSGLPYTPPEPGETIGNIQLQAPGNRFGARFPRYFRFDMGATLDVPVFKKGLNRPVSLQLTGEILNVFDMTNTVAFYWVPDGQGVWNRVPTRLTPRTINVRARIEF